MKKVFFSFLLFLYFLSSDLVFADLRGIARAAQVGNERVRANKKFAAKIRAARYTTNHHFGHNSKAIHCYRNIYEANLLPDKQDNRIEEETVSLLDKYKQRNNYKEWVRGTILFIGLFASLYYVSLSL